MALERFANNASTTLAAAVTTTPASGAAETWTVASTAAPFPQEPQFRLLVDSELVIVTARVSATQWTVTRGAEGTAPATHANAAPVRHVLTAEALRASWAGVPADYVMWREGASYFARNGWTGLVQFSGSEPGAVLQSVITALGVAGGSVVLGGREDFAWGSVPKIPKGIVGKLTIEVLGGRTVTLSTAGPRFVDFANSVAGDTFQNIELIGVTVDALAIQTDANGHHLLIGNSRGSSGSAYQINMRNIAVRRCKVLDGRFDTGPRQTAVYLVTFQDAASQPLNTIENILIENLVVDGCTSAVSILGIRGGTFTGNPDIWIDNVKVEGVTHKARTALTGFQASAHVHVGSYGQVGRVIVNDVYGYGSGDVGVEINCFHDARVTNVVLEEYNGFGVYFTNHRPPRRLRDQQAIVRNISGRHLAANSAVLSNACSLVAGVPLNANPIGSIVIDGAKYYRDVPSLTSSALSGLAVRVQDEVRAVSVSNFIVELENINHTVTTPTANPSPFYIVPTVSTCQVKLKNIYSSANGVAAASTSSINYGHVFLSGLMVLDLDDIAVRLDIVGASNFGHRALNIGSLSGSNISGRVRGLRVLSAAATQPRGIVIASTTTITIPSELSVEDGDFTAMPSPSIDVSVGAGQETKVRLERNKWRVFPLPPVGVTVGASPYLYRSLKGYRERVVVRGGTVTLIEFSRDGVTFYDAGETSGMFVLDNGDYLRVTYSAVPIMTTIPER